MIRGSCNDRPAARVTPPTRQSWKPHWSSEPSEQRDAFVLMATEAIARGRMDLVRFAASKALRLAQPGSTVFMRLVTYEAAALTVTGEFELGFAALQAADRAKLETANCSTRPWRSPSRFAGRQRLPVRRGCRHLSATVAVSRGCKTNGGANRRDCWAERANDGRQSASLPRRQPISISSASVRLPTIRSRQRKPPRSSATAKPRPRGRRECPQQTGASPWPSQPRCRRSRERQACCQPWQTLGRRAPARSRRSKRRSEAALGMRAMAAQRSPPVRCRRSAMRMRLHRVWPHSMPKGQPSGLLAWPPTPAARRKRAQPFRQRPGRAASWTCTRRLRR